VLGPLLSLLNSIFIQQLRGNLFNNRLCIRGIGWSDVCQQAKRYRNFPMFVLPRSFVNMLAGQLLILLLTPFFGAKLVGFYSLALLLGYTPIGTITRAVYQVLYQHTMGCVHRGERIGYVFKWFIIGSSAIIIPMFVGISFILPDITSWLLGAEWYVSGEYIRWMLPWLYVSFLSCSINYLFDVFMRQKMGLIFEILLAVFRVIGLAIGIWQDDFVMAIALYSIGTAVAFVIQIIWMLRQVHQYDQSIAV
jgi:O-antigen/teichoic acid export membrane protein